MPFAMSLGVENVIWTGTGYGLLRERPSPLNNSPERFPKAPAVHAAASQATLPAFADIEQDCAEFDELFRRLYEVGNQRTPSVNPDDFVQALLTLPDFDSESASQIALELDEAQRRLREAMADSSRTSCRRKNATRPNPICGCLFIRGSAEWTVRGFSIVKVYGIFQSAYPSQRQVRQLTATEMTESENTNSKVATRCR